jgi:ribosome biogenesis GTPase A
MLLINKADYLSEELIVHWNKYFIEKGVKHIFFSALEEQKKIDQDEVSSSEDSEDSDEDSDEEKDTKNVEDILTKIKIEDAVHATQ